MKLKDSGKTCADNDPISGYLISNKGVTEKVKAILLTKILMLCLKMF